VVCCQSERSQQANKLIARNILRAKLLKLETENAHSARNDKRRNQIGHGKRSDKIRTVQEQNGIVINHKSGKKIKLKLYLRGNIDKVQ